MSAEKIAFWVWTGIVIGVVFLVGNLATKDKVYNGTRIELVTSRDLQIEVDKVTFEAASSDFFVLRKETGETIVGAPTQRPLGWSSSKYFVFGPQEIAGGRWIFQDGNATIKITSEKSITVRAVVHDPADTWFGIAVLGFLVWFLFIVIAIVNDD